MVTAVGWNCSGSLGKLQPSSGHRVGFLVYREPGGYNWMRVALVPEARSRSAVHRGASFEVNCSRCGTFCNDYVYKMVYFRRCLLKGEY